MIDVYEAAYGAAGSGYLRYPAFPACAGTMQVFPYGGISGACLAASDSVRQRLECPMAYFRLHLPTQQDNPAACAVPSGFRSYASPVSNTCWLSLSRWLSMPHLICLDPLVLSSACIGSAVALAYIGALRRTGGGSYPIFRVLLSGQQHPSADGNVSGPEMHPCYNSAGSPCLLRHPISLPSPSTSMFPLTRLVIYHFRGLAEMLRLASPYPYACPYLSAPSSYPQASVRASPLP